jgi:hypothetical protein
MTKLSKQQIGKKFNKLTIIDISNERKNGYILYKCKCDCGNELLANISQLKRNTLKSCGCLRHITSGENIKKAEPLMLASGKWEKSPKIANAKIVYRKYTDGDITFDMFLTLSQQNCFYCGKEPSNKFNHYSRNPKYSEERKKNGYFIYNGLDRVDNTKGHTIDNVVPCCHSCNKAKADKTQEEFFQMVKRIYKLHSYRWDK